MESTDVSAAELHEESFFALASECTVEAWLNFLGHRWNALILYRLSMDGKRFGEITNCLPTVTPKVLAERLSALERRGLVERAGPTREAPYRLTVSGKTIMPILHALEVWARR